MVKVAQTELITGAIAGKVVSFPTDTVPALAVKPDLGQAIYQLKQRPQDKPLILLGATIDDLLTYVKYSPEELVTWQDLIKLHLPGALTLVLPASDKVPPAINTTESKTVGIRIPNSNWALAILRETGVMATSSANLSGQNTLVTMDAIDATFPEVMVLEADKLPGDRPVGSGQPSTVICWQNQSWQVLRQGSVEILSS
ncbi:MAG: L-threonylcarbamoyladenylate synthase [Cyanobacteria bacterium J06621_8]